MKKIFLLFLLFFLFGNMSAFIVIEGEPITVAVGEGYYEVNLSYIYKNYAVLSVNGEFTQALFKGYIQQLFDEVYIGLQEINFETASGEPSNVEFVLGAAGSICVDSDKGKDYFIQGKVFDAVINLWDTCQDNKTLNEYFCDGNVVSSINYTCSNFCDDGMCSSCTDSDGFDYFTKGTATGADGNPINDFCYGITYADGTLSKLKEYSCSQGELRSDELECACRDGACLREGGEKGCCLTEDNRVYFGIDEQQCDGGVKDYFTYQFFTDVSEENCKLGYCYNDNMCEYSLKSFCTNDEWAEDFDCYHRDGFGSCVDFLCSEYINCLVVNSGFCYETTKHACQENLGAIVVDESDSRCDRGCCKGLGDNAEFTHSTTMARCDILSNWGYDVEFDIEISRNKCAFINEDGMICVRGYCREMEELELDEIDVTPSVSNSGTIFKINSKFLKGEPDFFPVEIIISDGQISSSSSAGVIETLILFDDGDHGDKREEDGIYGNTFDSTNIAEGDYFVWMWLDGSIEKVATFSISNSQCIEVINNGNSAQKADIVFVGDNYSSTAEFIEALELAIEYEGKNYFIDGMFEIEPFKSNKEKFNIWAVDAGDSLRTGTIGSSNPDMDKEVTKKFVEICILHKPWPLTGCFYSIKIHIGYHYQNIPSYRADTLRASLRCPQSDYVVLLSKRDFRSFCFYSGDCYVSNGANGDYFTGRILTHELGHGFAGLADEYVEPSKGSKPRVNCVTTMGEAENKWGNLVGEGGAGYFLGCSYIEGNYRSTETSIMRNSGYNSFFFNNRSKIFVNKELNKYG